MGNISWLHLSDLHLGRDVYNEEVILKELLIDIKKQTDLNKIKLDFVFITGDITFSGQEKEFAYVQDFLNKLQNVTNVDKENIILIPGNHDVNREDLLSVAKNSKKLLNNREAISAIIGNDAEREIYTRGLLNYRKFIEHNFLWANSGKNDPLFYTINKRVEDVSISILAMNTAWLAYGDDNEKGKIILGERQVREAFNETDNPQITIALMHHPFEWLG